MPNDQLDERIRSLVARQVGRAPHVGYDELLERRALRGATRRRWRRQVAAAGVLLGAVAAVVAVVAVINSFEGDQTIVAGAPSEGSADASAGPDSVATPQEGAAGPSDPPVGSDWEMTTALQDGRPARLFLDDGMCIQIEGDEPVCESGLASHFDWFAVPTGSSVLIAVQYLLEPPVITTDVADDVVVTGEFGPGALYRALHEVPAGASYHVEPAQRDTLLEGDYDGGGIDTAELFELPDGRLCVELQTASSESVDCSPQLDPGAADLTVYAAAIDGWAVLFGAAPAATDMITIEDTDNSGTGADVAPSEERAVWLSDTAIVSLHGDLTITATDLIDDRAGDPTARVLATATYQPDSNLVSPTTTTIASGSGGPSG